MLSTFLIFILHFAHWVKGEAEKLNLKKRAEHL